MYNDGYKYWLAYKKQNTSYYRCARYKTNCPGRCVVEDDKVRNTTAHNHSPEPDRVLVDQFRKTLTYRAATETTDLYNIFWDEAIQRHADAAMLYTFAAAESAMRKARRKQLPPMPNTIFDLGDVLSKSNLFKIHSGQNRDEFYQTTLELSDSTCLIFIHGRTMEHLGRIDEMHIDVTFDIKSTSPSPNYTLLTVHAIKLHNSFPFLYVIMTNKNQATFAAILAYLREKYSTQLMPKIIVTNFNSEVQSAVMLTFPEATIKGSWTDYTTGVLNQTRTLELERETSRGHRASFLRMILVLPLLPAEYMVPGLEALKKWTEEKKILCKPITLLCTYVEQQWLRAMGAEKLSIFSIPHCIHNHIQQFNKDLENSFGGPNPTIWQMLESLNSFATRTYVKINKRHKQNASGTLPPPKKGQQALDSIIKNAKQLWIRTPVHLRNPLNFLQLCSHCINDTMFYPISNDPKRSKVATNSTSTTQSVNILETLTMSTSHRGKMTERQRQIIGQPSSSIQNLPKLNSMHGGGDIRTEPFSNLLSVPVRSDPPPLAFFSKTVSTVKKASKEPPPLIPIQIRR